MIEHIMTVLKIEGVDPLMVDPQEIIDNILAAAQDTLQQSYPDIKVEMVDAEWGEARPVSAADRSYQGGLTTAEQEVIDLLAEAYNLFTGEVMLPGPSAEEDVKEFAFFIHGAQRMVAAQSAVRAHPDKYRFLGGAVKEVT